VAVTSLFTLVHLVACPGCSQPVSGDVELSGKYELLKILQYTLLSPSWLETSQISRTVLSLKPIEFLAQSAKWCKLTLDTIWTEFLF
jgi:hypothetical protein